MEQGFRKRILRQDAPPHPLIVSIREVCARLDSVYSRFQQETDPDRIEACIYEMESLRAQYRYLLRTARLEGVSCGEKHHLWGGVE